MGTAPTPLSLQELARRIGAEVRGGGPGGAGQVSGVAPLETAGPSQIAFYANPRYRKDLLATRAGAVIVSDEDLKDVPQGSASLVAPQPYVAFAKASALFHQELTLRPGIRAGALVDETAEVHPTAAVSPGAYVGPGALVGARTAVHAGARILDGADLEGDGEGPIHRKVPQAGIARIEDDVELGACSCVDRATLGETVVGRGTKIDNLVQIGHNVRIGPLCLIVAQVGVSGSTELGQGVILAGQVGVIGHLRIGDGARVGAQSGVGHDVADGETVSGSPAINHREWLRMSVALPRVADLLREVRRLQQRIEKLEKEKGK